MAILPDFIQEPLEDVWDAGTDFAGDALGFVGEGVEDFMNNGKNRYQGERWTGEQNYWGGNPEAADQWAQKGWDGMAGSDASRRFAQGEAFNERDPQAIENQELSDREAFARGWHQGGALDLAQEAAMGLAPSAAEGTLRSGFNRAANTIQGQAGGARGAAAMATAQGNAANAHAGLMAEQANQVGILRANEMAGARNLYGGLSGQQREQDLQRLQAGNQMSQFNAQNNDNYRLGMGALGVQHGAQQQQWYTAAQNPYNQNLQAGMHNQALNQGSWDANQANEYGRQQANADLQRQNAEKVWDFGKQTAEIGAHKAAAGMGKS